MFMIAKNSYDMCSIACPTAHMGKHGGPVIRCVIIIFAYKNMCGLFNILYNFIPSYSLKRNSNV